VARLLSSLEKFLIADCTTGSREITKEMSRTVTPLFDAKVPTDGTGGVRIEGAATEEARDRKYFPDIPSVSRTS
jgi:hypothetical protein